MNRTADEMAEIERHKYFLSEKRGYDVGWEVAEQDWEANFAEQWRREKQQTASSDEVSPQAADSAPQAARQSTHAALADSDEHRTTAEQTAAPTSGPPAPRASMPHVRRSAAHPTPGPSLLRRLGSRLHRIFGRS